MRKGSTTVRWIAAFALTSLALSGRPASLIDQESRESQESQESQD
jgi:hypothetical protein